MTDQPLSFDQCIQYATLSDIGMRRQNNQDALNTMVSPNEEYWGKRGHLFVVADGMGAHAAGELASKIAADGVTHNYVKRMEVQPAEALRQAIIDANRQIHDKSKTDAGFAGMGTTCSAMILLPQGAVIGHVGDSRVYRLRGDTLDQLTFDHSLVWEMRAAGRVANAEAELSLPKNIITRSLGPNPDVRVDLEGPFPIKSGDTFLLCSDGLTGPVTDEELGAILRCLPPPEAVQTLVDLANLRGGPDNITVIVVRVDSPPVAEADPDAEKPTKRVHPIIWIVSGICLVAAAVMFFVGAKLPALLCGAGAAVAAIVGFLQKFDREEPVDMEHLPIPPLGRGPHTSIQCPPSAATVQELSKVSGNLRQAAERTGKDIQWDRIDALSRSAAESAEQGDFTEAIRQLSRGISFVVTELKKSKQQQRLSDSHVDLI